MHFSELILYSKQTGEIIELPHIKTIAAKFVRTTRNEATKVASTGIQHDHDHNHEHDQH